MSETGDLISKDNSPEARGGIRPARSLRGCSDAEGVVNHRRRQEKGAGEFDRGMYGERSGQMETGCGRRVQHQAGTLWSVWREERR